MDAAFEIRFTDERCKTSHQWYEVFVPRIWKVATLDDLTWRGQYRRRFLDPKLSPKCYSNKWRLLSCALANENNKNHQQSEQWRKAGSWPWIEGVPLGSEVPSFINLKISHLHESTLQTSNTITTEEARRRFKPKPKLVVLRRLQPRLHPLLLRLLHCAKP